MTIDNQLVGKAIARLRTMRGLTQAQLNDLVGMSTIQHIEQGRNAVSLACLDKIASALDFPPACILLLGSKIDQKDRVLSSLHSLLEGTMSLEVEQASPQKGVRPPATMDKSDTKRIRVGVRPRFEVKLVEQAPNREIIKTKSTKNKPRGKGARLHSTNEEKGKRR